VFVEEVAPPPPLPVSEVPVPAPARIGFHNLLAVRVALMAGALGLCLFVLLGQLPGLQVIAILSPIASGVFAVHLYKRKTGQRLSMASGAHLGWISGIFGFLITTLLFTAFAVMLTNPELAEASRDLGASATTTFRRVILPLTVPGIAAGAVFVFVLSIGNFVTPALLGGGRFQMIGNLVYDQFLTANDWPFGAALAMALIAIMLLVLMAQALAANRASGQTAQAGGDADG